jgi:hypothetical protein
MSIVYFIFSFVSQLNNIVILENHFGPASHFAFLCNNKVMRKKPNIFLTIV